MLCQWCLGDTASAKKVNVSKTSYDVCKMYAILRVNVLLVCSLIRGINKILPTTYIRRIFIGN